MAPFAGGPRGDPDEQSRRGRRTVALVDTLLGLTVAIVALLLGPGLGLIAVIALTVIAMLLVPTMVGRMRRVGRARRANRPS